MRHPFYAVLWVFFPSVPVLLGSVWGLLPALAMSTLLSYRAVREERHLMQTLDGYAAYAERVRYRLIPGIW